LAQRNGEFGDARTSVPLSLAEPDYRRIATGPFGQFLGDTEPIGGAVHLDWADSP
jgi:hypothetical protein